MPEPISSSSALSASFCDPNNACCEEPEVAVQQTGVPTKPRGAPVAAQPSEPAVVTIPPVHINGSAEKDLVKRYEQQVAQGCANERNSAIAGCSNVAGAVVDHGIGTAGTSSFVCAQLITAYDSCKTIMAQKLEFKDRCEDLGGVAMSGLIPNTAVCFPKP